MSTQRACAWPWGWPALGHSTDAIASCRAEPRAYTSVTADRHWPLTAERLLAARAIRMNASPASTTRARISHSQAGVLVLPLLVDVGDGVGAAVVGAAVVGAAVVGAAVVGAAVVGAAVVGVTGLGVTVSAAAAVGTLTLWLGARLAITFLAVLPHPASRPPRARTATGSSQTRIPPRMPIPPRRQWSIAPYWR